MEYLLPNNTMKHLIIGTWNRIYKFSIDEKLGKLYCGSSHVCPLEVVSKFCWVCSRRHAFEWKLLVVYMMMVLVGSWNSWRDIILTSVYFASNRTLLMHAFQLPFFPFAFSTFNAKGQSPFVGIQIMYNRINWTFNSSPIFFLFTIRFCK